MTKKRKRGGPYDPYPGWAPPSSDEDFYRSIAGGPVSFTRPAPAAAPTASPVAQKSPQDKDDKGTPL